MVYQEFIWPCKVSFYGTNIQNDTKLSCGSLSAEAKSLLIRISYDALTPSIHLYLAMVYNV